MTDIDLSSLSPAEKRALLAERLRQKGKGKPARRRRFPASFPQQRMWFLDQLNPGSAAYNIPAAVRVHGPLDVELWRRCLAEITRRHESLRTTFDEADGEPVQVVHDSGELELTVLECEHLRGPGGEERIKEMAREEFARPFDIGKGPLMRMKFLRLSADEHVLLLTMHHIVADLWSTSVLFGELVTLYQGYATGTEVELPKLPVQYADYAAWQRQKLAGPAFAEELDYWKKALAGAPPVLDLPTDRPRPPVLSTRGGSHPFHLSAPVMDGVRELSQRAGVTPFMTLLAAYVVLLHRYSREEDIVVGVPVANRGQAEVERLIGYFVNTLAIRNDVSGNPSFTELLGRVRQVCLGAFARQEVPFERLVEELCPERDLSRSPIFQVSFVFQNIAVPQFDVAGLRLELMEVESSTARFDLELQVFEQADGLDGWFEYNSELFDAATIERMGGHLKVLLDNLLADPDQPILDVALLTEEEARQQQLERDTTRHEWPDQLLTHQRIEAQAVARPEAEAVYCQGETLTYAQLDASANRLARRLKGLGVGRDVMVGVCLERSLDMVVAVLAVLKAGGAYVPVDPKLPKDRMAFMIEDAGLPVMITQSSVVPGLPESGATTLCLDEVRDELAAESADVLDEPVDPADLAYVIYTSGSTGRPKGVQLPHRALRNLFWAMKQWPGIDADDSLLAVTTLSFDIATLELLLPLVEGARVVLATREVATDGKRLADEMTTTGATMMQATPSTWRMLVDAGWEGRPGLRGLICGEALPPDLARRLRAKGVDLWNMYGPSEFTIYALGTRIVDDNITIGRPIANTEVHVLDPEGRPVPPGVPGELYIGGANLARGYINRPELTARAFIANPFESDLSDRLYRTGDLVRRRPNGDIDYLGRLDHQVKLRGYRIELGEIESVLMWQDQVKDTVVVVREDVPGDQRLVAYCVLHEAGAADEDVRRQLRGALAKKLPDYMVPSAFVFLDALPLTPSGKTDRGALPAPERGRESREVTFVAPRDAEEKALCDLFAQVLDVPEVGIDDSFFALGGHSLLATRLVARIRATLGVELPVRDLFEKPTVAELAELLRQGGGDSRPALRPADRPDPLPLSFAQRRLWFLHQMEGPSPTYNLPVVLRLTGALDVDCLRAALADVVARHESLRTVFPDTDAVACQHILAPEQARPALPVTEVAEEDLDEAVAAAVRHAFDLTTEIPLHAELFAVGPDTHVLAVVVHHIAADGWSLAPLRYDLAVAYRARLAGEEPGWEPLPVQYADYALWQRDYLGAQDDPGSTWARQLDYWRQALDGLPERIALPTDRPHPAEASHEGDTLTFQWDAELHEGLARLARSCDVSMFMVLDAALAVLLSRLGAGSDIPIGVATAGREDQAVENLIGFFANTLVLRTRTSDRQTFRELLAAVRERTLDALAHRDIPFESLVDSLRPTRSMAYHPMVQVMLSWQSVSDETLDLPGIEAIPVVKGTGTARMDLVFLLHEHLGSDGTPKGIDGGIEYNADVFDPDTVQSMMRRLRQVLLAMITDPDQPVGDVELLTPAERHRVLEEWNGSSTQAPAAGLPELFEAQVARTPDAVAVSCGDERLTYGELAAAADRLALRLRELGVGTEDAVCLLMERSVWVVAAILGVLKAGGVYVPFDPRYPQSRMQLIMEDTGATVLLVDGTGLEHPTVDGLRVVDAVAALSATGDTAEDLAAGAAGIAPAVVPDQAAYVMYTSGSTGRPKGVAVTHRNVASLAADHVWRGGNHSRVLMHAPTAFDASTYEMWVPLLSGGRVVVAPAGELDPDTLLRTITEQRVTSAFFTAALFNLLVERDPAALAGMREVMAGGEALSPPVVARALAAWPETVLTNGYGPTETTTFAVLHSTREVVDGTVPIGTPMDDTRAYVLDESLRPVPVGVAGELYLAGQGLARGYFGQPGLTSQRFVASPYGPPGERMYRTGDLARWRADGTIEYLGRTDDQVKIRGFRIEPGEIENVLAGHPAVANAAVVVRAKPTGGKDLVGYAVLTEGAQAEPGELRAFVAERLPQYMVPVTVMVLDAFPMSANGKLDRRALPAPDLGAVESRAARTPVEATLCTVFSEVLGVPEVGAEVGFFDLGGDSIQATQLVAQARTAGLVFTVRDVFTHQTVAGIAQVARPAGEERGTVVADVGTGEIPLLPVMERQRQLGGSVVGFDLSATVGLPADIDQDRLTAALQAVVDQHDALRTRLVVAPDGQWSLHADEPGTVRIADRLRRVDTARLTEAEARALIAEETAAAKERLDPAAGAMVEPVWFDAGPGRMGRLLLAVHHFAVDGVSWRILLSDLAAAWEAVAAGREPTLPPVTTSLRGWAGRLTSADAIARHRAELPVWQDVLADAPALVAGRLDAARDVTGTEGRLSVTLPAEDTAPLVGKVPAVFRRGIQDVLLAAFSLAAAHWRARRTGDGADGGPVVLDVESHGRHEHLVDGVDLSRTVGWFTSIHPVRLDGGRLSWDEVTEAGTALATAVVQTGRQVQAIPERGLGYGLLRYLDAESAATLAALPAPQVLFNYLGRVPVTDGETPWMPLRDDTAPGGTGERPLAYPLEVNAVTQDGPDGPQLVANWNWAGSLLTEDDVRELADAWFDALRAVARCARGIEEKTVELVQDARDNAPAVGAADLLNAPIPKADRSEGAGLSFGQLEFLLQPVGPNHAHHAVITAWHLRGELDVPALRRGLNDLVQRHDVLRTRYVYQGSSTIQFADGEPVWPIDAVDLREHVGQAQRDALRDLLRAETEKPFRIENGNLVRGLLVRLGEQEHALVLVAHHILVDHWGFLVVMDELAELYAAHTSGRQPKLPEVMVQHLDYAAWEQGLLASGALDAHIEHWRREMDGAARRLDFDAPDHQQDAFVQGYSHPIVVDAEIMSAVKDAARREGVTLFMMLMAAFHVLLHSYSGATDIAVSHPLAGRERPESKWMVGPFINIILNRSRMADDPTFHDLLQQVMQGELDAYSHQNVPVRALVHDGVVGDGNQLPLRVMLNLLGVPTRTLELTGLDVEPLDVQVGDESPLPGLITAIEPHNLDLYLVAREVEGTLRGLWVYKPDYVAPPVMGALVRQWPRVLELVAHHPDLTVSQLRARVLAENTLATDEGSNR